MLLYQQMQVFFSDVCITKPPSSRNSSIESFIVCRNFELPEGYEPSMFQSIITQKNTEYFAALSRSEINRAIIPFIVSGDYNSLDSDRSYSLDTELASLDIGLPQTDTEANASASADSNREGEKKSKYVYHAPTQTPIDPPYKIACQLKKAAELAEPDQPSVSQ